MDKQLKMITVTLLVLGFSAVSIHASSHEGHAKGVKALVDYRQGAMQVIGWNFKAIAKMVKGEAPFDKASFERHAADINRAAQLDILAGFPEDSEHDESRATADIWFKWDEFEKKMGALTEAAEKLEAAAAAGDEAAMKAQFGETGKTCKGCHKAFRE